MGSASKDLFQIGTASTDLLDSMRRSFMHTKLDALAKGAEAVGKAWSGSNIGYHACVYTHDLMPRPPSTQFSSEWGLMNEWPVHEPSPIWRVHDADVIIQHILKKASNPDLDAIRNWLAPIAANFLRLKEEAVSILHAEHATANDGYLKHKLVQIGKLKAYDVATVTRAILPNGQIWSRDSLAMSQGLQAAPHQCIAAVPVTAISLEKNLDDLERACRESASHLQRLDRHAALAGRIGTNVFIGHGRSLMWRELKDFIEDRLHLPVDEFNSVPVAGISNVERLSQLLDAAAFAFLVMTAEDERADGALVARTNVVHEVGLFQGRLGFPRAVVLLEEGCEEFSNIHGLGQLRFPRGNVSAVFEQVRAVLERERLLTA
jgi:predicted nucleotide-binding protein